jgi:hypothetical protein
MRWVKRLAESGGKLGEAVVVDAEERRHGEWHQFE